MEKIPREILDLIEDLYKRVDIDPRVYPIIQAKWNGCGDSGGLEEIHFLSVAGAAKLKSTVGAYNPPETYGEHAHEYWHGEKQERQNIHGPGAIPMYWYRLTNGVNHLIGYEFSQYIYEKFDLCEINDGSHCTAYIEMPHGNIWGGAWHWEMQEIDGTQIEYED